MPNTFRWKRGDLERLSRLKVLWPELDVSAGARMAQIRVPSLKALTKLLNFFSTDEDLAVRIHPLPPGSVKPKRPHWWYTMVEDAPYVFKAQVNVPPDDLQALLMLLEERK